MLDPARIRAYVAFLDADRVGRVGYVDVDARDPTRVLAVSPRPVLDIGEQGTFDDNGVTPVCILREGRKLHLFYVGWQLHRKIRYTLLAGLAVSDDGGKTFRRTSRVPLLERSEGEMFIRTASYVLKEEAYRMWYIGGERWVTDRGKQVPSYDLRYLESDRLECWGRRAGRVLMEPDESRGEYGFGRPFILKGDVYRMWYSIRLYNEGYRLGYAESPDGLSWERKDEQAGLNVSASGWDSEMVCYAAIQQTEHGTYMFYNGNNYGETGFGVARLVDGPRLL